MMQCKQCNTNDATQQRKEMMQLKDTMTEGNKATMQQCKETTKCCKATIKYND